MNEQKEIPFEPTLDLDREAAIKSIEATPEVLLQQKATQCCNAIVVHGEGAFRCSMCANPIITSIGAVHPSFENGEKKV